MLKGHYGSKAWGIGSSNADSMLTLILFALVCAGIIQLLYRVGYVRKERRGRILCIVMAVVLLLGIALGIAGV